VSPPLGSAGALADAPPLIETKLLPPRGRAELVARPRLLKTLDGLSSAALTLVDAPVGFGKTVLAQSWGAQADTAIAWVSIDAADNDPVRLWTYVATAVDRIRSGLGRGALSRLQTAGAPPEVAVDELINGITAFGGPLAVVLDDLHALQSDACLRSLEHAVELLPAHARIVATTRSDPAIALGRLRARGALGEIRASELAFNVDEARELIVGQEHIALTTDDVEMLVDRTEGWPAGLYLAALWLRTLEDPSAGIRDFHGDHRHVADYLTGEVLDTLAPETREFLLRTSVLGRFNGALCDAVLDRTGSARFIAGLARSNLFLVALDPHGEWFRYHHLFRELLQLELGLVDPSAATLLHLRASAWCREHGLTEEALEHADAAGDEESVAAMLVEGHADLMRTGRQATLLRWLTELPQDRILANPILAPAGALASGLLRREDEERRAYIAMALRAREQRSGEWTPYHEAALGLSLGISVNDDIGAAVVSARRTAEIGRPIDELAVPALASLGYLLFLSGAHDEASVAAREALARPEATARPHGYVYALATLSFVDAAMGDAREAESKARRALAAASASGLVETASGGLARLALASALSVTGRLPDAEREAVRAERLRQRTHPDASHIHALLVLADIRAQRGQLSRASENLERARAALDGFRDPGALNELAAGVERRIAEARLATGTLEVAPSAAELSVLRLLAGELSQREIGAQLFLSVNTVKTHTRALYRKLGATSREAAVARAMALGLLDGDESPG
jgi:LuxR family transcriptional regulator, maltose regulon positive regulatory protein